jgi:hypothetical protein
MSDKKQQQPTQKIFSIKLHGSFRGAKKNYLVWAARFDEKKTVRSTTSKKFRAPLKKAS